MTPRIIRALVRKEQLRYWHNRPSLVLAILLVLVSLLVATSQKGGLLGAVDRDSVCYITYWEQDAFVRYLQEHTFPGHDVRFGHVSQYPDEKGMIRYPSNRLPQTGTVAIQIRPGDAPSGTDRFDGEAASPPKYCIEYWYLDGHAEDVLPYRDWFNQRFRTFHGNQPLIAESEHILTVGVSKVLPIHRVMTALVCAAVYLLCFHLNIVITSEERERRTLLAQMLTPVSVLDYLTAKACFYVPATLLLAGIIVVTTFPVALSRPTFWITLASASIGYLSIGLIICSVTRSQSAAGLTALAYFVCVGVTIYLASTVPVFAVLRIAFIDYHLIQLMHYNMIEETPWWVPLRTCFLAGLAFLWAWLAVKIFARRGWHTN